MTCTRSLRAGGTIWVILGVIVRWIETAWFGFNPKAASALEAQWDAACDFAIYSGFILLLAAWLRSLTDSK